MPDPARSHTQEGAVSAAGDSAPTEIPPCMATMDVVPDGDRMTVTVWGELDLGSRRLLPDLHDILTLSGSGIDLRLDAIGFCDCSGLNMLLDLRMRALDQGKTVAVRSSGRAVERLLDLTGTRALFAVPGPHEDAVGPTAAAPGPGAADDQDLRAEVAQLRRAMQTRPTIDLARGILMASFSLSPEAAWSVLVRTSQNTNTKLHHLARDLVGTIHGSTLPEPVQQQLAAAVASTSPRTEATACPATGAAAEDSD
ncbi:MULTISPECIES: ANTAR domain-containing protein [Streptomyces]|uniref:Anti-anti-sigma factor n=1 Tax=Streptomyces chartreusis NRRL 3882 TaxID=1079985 RepID=A0A2N9B4C5_STRCX|nr:MULTISPECIES: ANTAR domain-containing protein [Streptomyces]MYS95666.1 ANTAR domain-containing protein [Streptomyces sp. SID5464]SOR78205.1 anti-anti-sigma factor [Streptomyces chartreusis NRRL 3882]